MDCKIVEIRCLIDALAYCDNEERYETLLNIIINLINGISPENNGVLLWLKTRIPHFGENGIHGNEVLEQRLRELLKKSATLGCKEAQYEFACLLYEEGSKEEAIDLYRCSALQGYAPAQWVFGLDTLNGVGSSKNFEQGKFFIELSAAQGYEYAVEFLISSYQHGTSGFPQNYKEVEKWKSVEYRYDII